MIFRPATRDDLLEFVPAIPATARAYAAEEGGTVYGVGGVYYALGRVFAFSHARPDMPKRDRVKGARKVMDIVKTVDGPVWAIRGMFETADRVLRHFGFEQVGDTDYYLWRKAA